MSFQLSTFSPSSPGLQLLLELFLHGAILSYPAATEPEPFKKLGHCPSSCWIWESWLLCAGAPREQLVPAFRGTGAAAQLGTLWTQAQGNSSLLSAGLILFHNLIQATGCSVELCLLAVHLPNTLPHPFLIKQWAQVSQFGCMESGEEMALALVPLSGHSLKRAGQYLPQAVAHSQRRAWSRIASNQIAAGVCCWACRSMFFSSLFSLKKCKSLPSWLFLHNSCVSGEQLGEPPDSADLLPWQSRSALKQDLECCGQNRGSPPLLLQPVKREMLLRMDRGVSIQLTWIIYSGERAHKKRSKCMVFISEIYCVRKLLMSVKVLNRVEGTWSKAGVLQGTRASFRRSREHSVLAGLALQNKPSHFYTSVLWQCVMSHKCLESPFPDRFIIAFAWSSIWPLHMC